MTYTISVGTPPKSIQRFHNVTTFRIKFHCVIHFILLMNLTLNYSYMFACLSFLNFFILPTNFFLFLLITFNDVLSLIAIILWLILMYFLYVPTKCTSVAQGRFFGRSRCKTETHMHPAVPQILGPHQHSPKKGLQVIKPIPLKRDNAWEMAPWGSRMSSHHWLPPEQGHIRSKRDSPTHPTEMCPSQVA